MNVLVLLADGFDDLEYFVPAVRLREEGARVTIATPTGQAVTGQHGYRVLPDTPIREVNPAEYDLLLIPGGASPERLRLRAEAVDVARTFFDDERRIAALGHGAQLLLSAGVLGGRRVACSEGIRDDVRAAGASYRDEPAVVDGALLTGRGAADLPRFCAALVAFAAVAA